MPLKEFVLFRHAHKSPWSSDPELSNDGLRQAAQIVELIHQKTLPKPQQLISSPKKRAQQTLSPLQEEFQIPLIIDPALDERNNLETGAEFESRIKEFLQNDLPTKPHTCVFLCTHLDWLDVFSWTAPLLEDISNELIHLPPAHYFHFELSSDLNTPWTIIRRGGVR